MKSAAEYAQLAERELRLADEAISTHLQDWYVARAAVYATLCTAAPVEVLEVAKAERNQVG